MKKFSAIFTFFVFISSFLGFLLISSPVNIASAAGDQGAACSPKSAPGQCNSGLRCQPDCNSGKCTEDKLTTGTCEPPLPYSICSLVGKDCGQNFVCTDRFGDGSGSCVPTGDGAGVCNPKKPLTDGQCLAGYSCQPICPPGGCKPENLDPNLNTYGECAPVKAGSKCDIYGKDCGLSLECINVLVLGKEEGYCHDPGTLYPKDTLCNPTHGLQCEAGLYCEPFGIGSVGRCHEPREGAKCDPAYKDCGPDLRCIPASGGIAICEKKLDGPGGEGALCDATKPNQCATGLYCPPPTSKCKKPEKGNPCDPNLKDCGPDLSCVQNGNYICLEKTGTKDGFCRPTEPRCDGNLTCKKNGDKEFCTGLPAAPPPPCGKLEEVKDSKGNVTSFKCLAFNTAFGNIATDAGKFIAATFGIILSISGAIALLLIARAGFKIMTSEGKPESVKEGRDQLIAAIVGLMLMIFSLVFLELIGVDILRIPCLNNNPCPASTKGNPGTGNPPNNQPNYPDIASCSSQTLQSASSGDCVRTLQHYLNITEDGIFGPQTNQAVVDYQTNKGLKIDGIVGPCTWGALKGDPTPGSCKR